MSDNWTCHELRVRYSETDQMGVVYHVNYLNWFEIGRTEWIRAKGITYQELEERGMLLPLTDAEIKFRLPARYDDQIIIYTKMIEFSNVRLQFASEIRRFNKTEQHANPVQLTDALEPQGELLVSGMSRHVWVNPSWKPIRIDKMAPDLFQIIKGL
ncbi:MAG: acyl-CoA thioesterase [Bacilli bacterium]|jgi:acyl-CoA thioester hydrolase|nr:acyl-CoA thioesterase [Bacilli bacterium]